jgi:hypothetical protein
MGLFEETSHGQEYLNRAREAEEETKLQTAQQKP